MRSRKYEAYINSDEWKKKSNALLWEAGFKCQKCGVKGASLQVHHLNYDRLGRERKEDLQVLCGPCHRAADSRRRVETETNTWQRRVDGYARKKYGDDWADFIDPEGVEDELREYIESDE